MNRIYKVIWSKVKHQYVVVSELAHRDGKRSSAASKSVRMLLAVLAVCGMTAFGLGMQDVYAGQDEGVIASSGQYVAIGQANRNEMGVERENIGTSLRPQYYKMIGNHKYGNHKYIYTETEAGNFWVREGYTIKVAHDQRFPGTNKGIDTVIETYKGENADTTGILQSYQNVESNMGVSTLNGKHLQTTTTDMYVGAVNTPTTEITSAGNQFYIYRGSDWVNVGQNNFASNFNYRDVIYDEATGLYTFRGEVVSTENLYSINGNVGVFTTTPGGTEVYTGDVYGWNNEILVTGVDEDGNYVSYWGSENVDPNAPIGNMPMSTLQYKFDVVNDNIKAVAEDNIKQINIGQSGNDGQVNISKTDDGQGGTIGLQTNGTFDEKGNPRGGAMIPGGIKITSEHGNDGNGVRIKFANDAGSFTVDAGSKVVGKNGDAVANEGETLTSVDINGKNYLLGGGKTYGQGAGIAISDDGNNTISVALAKNSGLHFEDNQLASNLKVVADPNATDTNKNGGNWTATDTKGTATTEDDLVLTNTTLDAEASGAVEGTKVTSTDGKTTYGQDYAIKDTDGNTVTIEDVASADTLKTVDEKVIGVQGDITTINSTLDGAVMYRYDEDTKSYDKNYVDLAGTQYDNKIGGTHLTNVAYATGEDGSEAVNVDYLNDHAGSLVQENNNIILAKDPNATEANTNGGNWTATDTKGTAATEDDLVLTNTTLDAEASGAVEGTKVTSTDGKTTYGQDYAIKDTDGNTVTIEDVASADTLKAVDEKVIGVQGDITTINSTLDGAVMYRYDEDTKSYDKNYVDLAGTKYDNKIGGTHLTNVAYATGEDGSEAVNVDYLNDHAGQLVYGNNNIKVTADPNATATNANGGNWTITDTKGTEDTTDDATFTNTTLDEEASGAVEGTKVTSTDGKTTYGQDYAIKDTDGNTVTIEDVASAETLKAVDEKVGDTQYKHTDGSTTTIVTAGEDVTISIGKLDGAIVDLQGKVDEAGKHSTVSVGNGLELETTGATDTAGTNYKVSLADDFTLGGKEDDTGKIEFKGSEGTLSASGNISAGSFSTTGGITMGKNEEGINVVSGLGNLTWDETKDYSQSGIAATEAQLQKATEAAVQYDYNEDGSVVNKGSVTFAGENGTTLKNVAAGEISATSTQAINGSQLWQTNQAVINNSNNISMLSNSVNKLDNRIDRVGAGAAALAALHPLDFDPDAKWDFAAGYGNYRGANAVAVGAYYRPNEDVMFSVGGSMGGGENMVNAGVSLKIGAGSSNVTTSRVAMAKEIKSMRDIVAKQDAQIQKLTAMVNALVGIQSEPDTTTMFPDVPENHWAYEAVEAMAKSGLVKGYPDGEFKGDRTMTRYEFAQIVYNAIQAGAEVDARLVEEFKPELEYFHIATVAKDKDGNPTIERVRAN